MALEVIKSKVYEAESWIIMFIISGVLAFSGCSDDEWEGLRIRLGVNPVQQFGIGIKPWSLGKVVRDTAGEWRESRYVGAGRGVKCRSELD
ncbi:MAG: hypothetical protein V8R91_03695 [Butyricimonas faecihominis]